MHNLGDLASDLLFSLHILLCHPCEETCVLSTLGCSLHSPPPGVCLTRPPRLSTSVTPRSSVMLFLAAQWGRPLFSDLLSTQAGLHPNPRALCHPNQCTFLSLLGGCKHLVDRSPIGVRGGPQWPAQSLTRRVAFPGSPRWGSSLCLPLPPLRSPLGAPIFSQFPLC